MGGLAVAEGDVAGAEVGGWLALDGAAVWMIFVSAEVDRGVVIGWGLGWVGSCCGSVCSWVAGCWMCMWQERMLGCVGGKVCGD